MKYAFILALGRSGTEFLSRMLQHDTQAAVYHEPYEEDPIILNIRHAGFNRVADNMMTSRFDKMSERSAGSDIHLEINSYLRYEAPWLKEHFNATMLHLVRDGRTFLPSAFMRDVYTPTDIQRPIVPYDSDPYAERWEHMSRFEKICWYWNHTNSMLADSVNNFVHMEDLLEDYAILKTMVLSPFGITLSKETWRSEVQHPSNTRSRYWYRRTMRGMLGRAPNTRRETLPHFDQWSKEQKDSFRTICGETMERLGYSL